MITLRKLSDINFDSIQSVAWGYESVSLDQCLLESVDASRDIFLARIAEGLPCYGVTTGLGNQVGRVLEDEERASIATNMLRARSAAVGRPIQTEIVRATMMIRLINFLSGRDGVSAALVKYIVGLLNARVTPWIPEMGHGMAADAIANSHGFQVITGEGFVVGEGGCRLPAGEGLLQAGLDVYTPKDKEGIALINGVTIAPAFAIAAYRRLLKLLGLANYVSAMSVEGLAAPKDAFDSELLDVVPEPGVRQVLKHFQKLFTGSEVTPFKLQAPVSYRVIPQVHGAMHDALNNLLQQIHFSLGGFSGNPMMTSGQPQELLSVGVFHNQQLPVLFDNLAVWLVVEYPHR